MHTSLNLLRENDACVGGFTRMASLLGVRPPVKELNFPVWMVGLIGTKDDMLWAIENAMVIDRAHFEEVVARTQLQVFNIILWKWVSSNSYTFQHIDDGKSTFHKMIQEAKIVCGKTADDVDVFLKKWRNYSCSERVWNDLILWSGWHNPVVYLKFLVEHMKTCLYKDHKKFLLGNAYREEEKVEKPTKYRTGAGPRTSAVIASVAAKKAVKVTRGERYFPTPDNYSEQEAFAYILLGNETDPYTEAVAWMHKANFAKLAGVSMQVTQLNGEGDKPPMFQATFCATDPRAIFRLAHLLQCNDFNARQVFGIDKVVKHVRTKMQDINGIGKETPLSDVATVGRDEVLEAITEAETSDFIYSHGREGADDETDDVSDDD